jgi:hypothetical protein
MLLKWSRYLPTRDARLRLGLSGWNSEPEHGSSNGTRPKYGTITLSKRRDGLALDDPAARLIDMLALVPRGIRVEFYP